MKCQWEAVKCTRLSWSLYHQAPLPHPSYKATKASNNTLLMKTYTHVVPAVAANRNTERYYWDSVGGGKITEWYLHKKIHIYKSIPQGSYARF
jgi:hypothetical protein